ncbi:MAG: DUF2834 domain-containing protein [Gemmobacter sp.]
MSPLRMVWLGLAVWGAVHPMYHMLGWLSANGWSTRAMLREWFGNAASAGLAWDMVIASHALVIWIVAETAVRRNREALLAIPATLLVGPSFGLPLYLFLRSRPVR